MKEASIGGDQSLIAHHQTAELAEPGDGPFHEPPPAIPPQLPAILMGGSLVVAAGRDNGLNPPAGQASPQGIAVVPPIRNQAGGPLPGPSRFARPPDGDRAERWLEEGNLRRGCRVQVYSQRSTRAIDQNHPLCALAPFGRADFGSPFFAGMKRPSTKHSSQHSCCWSFSWAKKARQSLSRRPVSSQALSRRQQVLGLPYRRGSSLHWAPVQRIQRMPSKQLRSSTRGRPPRGETLGWGRWMRMASHCCLVSFRHAIGCPPILPGNSWRYHTPTPRF